MVRGPARDYPPRVPAPADHGIPPSPVRELLGLRIAACGPEGADVRLPVRRALLQEVGLVQGGIVAALADASAVYPLLRDLPAGRGVTSIEFKLSFLRPARLGGGELRARSSVVRRGRTVALCKVVVEQGSAEVARGLFTYLFQDQDPGAAPPSGPDRPRGRTPRRS